MTTRSATSWPFLPVALLVLVVVTANIAFPFAARRLVVRLLHIGDVWHPPALYPFPSPDQLRESDITARCSVLLDDANEISKQSRPSSGGVARGFQTCHVFNGNRFPDLSALERIEQTVLTPFLRWLPLRAPTACFDPLLQQFCLWLARSEAAAPCEDVDNYPPVLPPDDEEDLPASWARKLHSNSSTASSSALAAASSSSSSSKNNNNNDSNNDIRADDFACGRDLDQDPMGARVAYLLMVRESDTAAHVARIVRRLAHPRHVVLVHAAGSERFQTDVAANVSQVVSDLEAASSEHQGGVARVRVEMMPTQPTRWGDWSLMRVTLDGAKRLVDMDDGAPWDYFINLSGSHYPIKTPLEIGRFLAKQTRHRGTFAGAVLARSEADRLQAALREELADPDLPLSEKKITKMTAKNNDKRRHISAVTQQSVASSSFGNDLIVGERLLRRLPCRRQRKRSKANDVERSEAMKQGARRDNDQFHGDEDHDQISSITDNTNRDNFYLEKSNLNYAEIDMVEQAMWSKERHQEARHNCVEAGQPSGDFYYLPFKRSYPPALETFKGSQWVALTRAFVEYATWPQSRRNQYWRRFFQNSWIPDESYFQTVLLNSPFSNTVIPESLTFMIFPQNAIHPHTLTKDDWTAVIGTDQLFARKITAAESAGLMDEIDHMLDMKIEAGQ